MKATLALLLSVAAVVAIEIVAHGLLPLTFIGQVAGWSGPVPAYGTQTPDLPVLGLFVLLAAGCTWAAYKLWRGILLGLGVLLVVSSLLEIRDLAVDRGYRSSAIVLHRRSAQSVAEAPIGLDRDRIQRRILYEYDLAGAFLAAGTVLLYAAARRRRRTPSPRGPAL